MRQLPTADNRDAPSGSIGRSVGSTFLQIIGGVVAIVGCVVLLGWALGIQGLTSLIPGSVTMKANAALAFVLSGGALFLLPMPGAGARRAARVGVVAVGGIALLTLGEYVAGWNFGIDQLLFSDPGTIATSHPGRMAPNAAICFVLTAAALWLMCRPAGNARRPLILGWLGSVVIAVGLLAMLGYIVGFSGGYRWWNFTGMAVHTAFLFVLLGAAILGFVWRETGMRWLINPWLTVGFASGLALIVVVAGYSHRATTELVDAAARVNRTHEIIRTIGELKADLEEQQSGMRGFLITGDEAFLPLSTNAISEAGKHLRKLRERTANDASQQARIVALERLIAERLDNAQGLIELRRLKGFDETEHRTATNRGKSLSDQIRAGLREMAADEERLLAARQAQADETTERTFAILPAGLLLSVLLLSFGVFRFNGEVAARQRGTEALRESEERFRMLFENASDAIFILQGERFVDCNARALVMFGCASREQFVGHPPYEFSPPLQPDGRDSRESAIEKITAAMAGQPQVFEWMHTKLDGSPFPAEVSLNKVEMREKVLLQAFVRDITERKQADDALRSANQKLRLFFEQTPMAVIEWDMDFRVTRWNPAARTIFGFSHAEAVGRHASFIVPEVFRPHVAQVWQGLLKQTGGERSSNENVRKDGRTILCEWYNTPLIDERGVFTGAASVVMDITERTHAQQLLAWEKSALELISSAASLHEVLDGLMLSLEKQSPGALCSVLLLDADGLHLRHGAGPSLPDAYNRLIDGVAIGPAVGSCGTAAYENRQVIVSDIASDPLWAEYRELAFSHGLRACWSTPIHCSKGKILGTFAIYYREPRHPVPAELDLIARAVHVTRIAIERKHAEEEIRQWNASLEERVRERTVQLETAVKELDAFSYSVSHDLRAPLRAVDGFSRMLIEDCAPQLDEEGRRMLGVIRNETQRMGQLIDDLLAFSRLGRQQIDPAPIDMHALAQGVFDELAALAPERRLRLDLRSLPPARGAEPMIRQVWVNLIGNALKFTQTREVGEIEIGIQESAEDGPIYYVKDNGAGFDMRYADKLFGVFQRLHTQQEFPGTGVGLALVQRIVQRHGGRVWAKAEVDRGATFYFSIPNPK